MIRTGAIVLSLFSLALLVLLGLRFARETNRRQLEAFDHAKRQAFATALKINRQLDGLPGRVRSVAKALTDARAPGEVVIDQLAEAMRADTGLERIGAAFEPQALPEPGLYAPYLVRDDQGDLETLGLEQTLDYTRPPGNDGAAPDTEWYHRPMASGPGWNEPYYSEQDGTFIAQYAAPFYRVDLETLQPVPAGVVFAEYSLSDLTEMVNKLDLQGVGYSFILSRRARFIAHPSAALLGRSLVEGPEEQADAELRSVAEKVALNRIFSREATDPATGQTSWRFYEPVPATGWSIGIVLDKEALLAPGAVQMRNQMVLALAAVLFLSALSVVIFRAELATVPRLWAVAGTLACSSVGAIVFIWYLAISQPLHEEAGLVLIDRATLDQILFSTAPPAGEVHHVPTGLYLRSLKFTASDEIKVTGYLWQKYSERIPRGIPRGFTLPQAVEPFASDEVYRFFDESGSEIIGWFFDATLQQSVDAAKYPFDQATVQIQIWPRTFTEQVMLTPALEAYEFINPVLRPGLAPDVAVEGWDIRRSFFSYDSTDYNADFGGARVIRDSGRLELHYNVAMARAILSPLLTHLVMISTVAALLFGVLMVPADSFSVLSYGAALFFIVAIAHVGLRQELGLETVAYIEYFFIMMYVITLGVSINSMLLKSEKVNWPFIDYGDNLIPKLLYWPLTQVISLAITTAVFFPRP